MGEHLRKKKEALDLGAQIIKIIEIKSRERIAFPKEVREILNKGDGDKRWLAFLKDPTEAGVRVVPVKLDTSKE